MRIPIWLKLRFGWKVEEWPERVAGGVLTVATVIAVVILGILVIGAVLYATAMMVYTALYGPSNGPLG